MALPPHEDGRAIIGFKRGTGGSSGVAFLKSALDHSFFPNYGRCGPNCKRRQAFLYWLTDHLGWQVKPAGP